MKTNASLLTLRIPNELKHNIKITAEQQGISINQLALYALTKEIKSMQTSSHLESYWKQGSESDLEKNFGNVLNKVKDKNNDEEVPEWDKL